MAFISCTCQYFVETSLPFTSNNSFSSAPHPGNDNTTSTLNAPMYQYELFCIQVCRDVLVSIFPVGFGIWMALSCREIGTLMHGSGLQA
jgi:hypothetical protein